MQGLRLSRLAVLLLALALPARLLAQAPATVSCKDGTTAKGGKGACSHHGGVAKTTAAPAAAEATPAKPAATVSCKDGSTSKPGKGACSHHGGVGAAVAAAAPANPPAAIPANPPLPVTAKQKAPAPSVAAAAAPSGAPADASAQCKDGSFSHAQHHRGACSKHGGVQQWLKDVPK